MMLVYKKGFRPAFISPLFFNELDFIPKLIKSVSIWLSLLKTTIRDIYVIYKYYIHSNFLNITLTIIY